MKKQIILVTGATGAQGGSVARFLLEEGKFAVRCLTRNAESPKAIELKSLGAEIVQGDLNNINSLEKVMEGCYGVFGVTNFWEHFGNEYQQGINLVESVCKTGIDHFIYSGLDSSDKMSGGQFKVPHLDIKAAIEEYARKLKPDSTFVHISFYFENFFTFFPPQLDESGCYNFGFPQGDTKLAGASVEDLGGVVRTLFNQPEKFKARTVGVVGSDITMYEYAAAMTEVLNHTVKYNYIPHATYAAFGFPGCCELADMFEYNRLFILDREADRVESFELFPGMLTFREWLVQNKEKFPFYKSEPVSELGFTAKS